MEKADLNKAKNKALDILDTLAYTHPPVNPLEIAREKGVDVSFVKFRHNNISGFYDFEKNAIIVNKEDYPPRQIFTIAHELGHKILHEEWAQSENYKVLLRDQFADISDPYEQEANAFAANLLVPEFMLKHYKDIASVKELATLFTVSEQVIRIRLKNIG